MNHLPGNRTCRDWCRSGHSVRRPMKVQGFRTWAVSVKPMCAKSAKPMVRCWREYGWGAWPATNFCHRPAGGHADVFIRLSCTLFASYQIRRGMRLAIIKLRHLVRLTTWLPARTGSQGCGHSCSTRFSSSRITARRLCGSTTPACSLLGDLRLRANSQGKRVWGQINPGNCRYLPCQSEECRAP